MITWASVHAAMKSWFKLHRCIAPRNIKLYRLETSVLWDYEWVYEVKVKKIKNIFLFTLVCWAMQDGQKKAKRFIDVCSLHTGCGENMDEFVMGLHSRCEVLFCYKPATVGFQMLDGRGNPREATEDELYRSESDD